MLYTDKYMSTDGDVDIVFRVIFDKTQSNNFIQLKYTEKCYYNN